MAINFPNNPSNGNTYAFNSITWAWNGAAWDRQSTNVVGITGATGPQGVTGATGPVGDYVVSFNGITGAVTGVTTSTANTFTALNSFSAGLSAAGGVTFSGTFSGTTGSFSKLLTASGGLSASGATFSGTISAAQFSGVLTSCTGLPVSTGITGFGSGIATFLATPTSANLKTALTDETGGGKVMFSTDPIVTESLSVTDPVGNIGALLKFSSNNALDSIYYGVNFGSIGTTSLSFIMDDFTDPTYRYMQIDADKIIKIGDVNGVCGGTNLSINNTTQTIAVTGRLTASGATFSGNISAPNIVNSWNGATGAVTFTNYVTSFNGKTGAVQGVSAAVAGTGISVSGATGSVTITNTGVQSFNGLTGAVTGVTVGGANIFTALNSFGAGISAAGGVTLSGSFSGTTGSFSKLLTASSGLSASGATFSGSISAPNIVNSWNGSTGAITFANYVASFNGLTGAVTGVTAGGANIFTALNSFGAGISAAGATFSDAVKASAGFFTDSVLPLVGGGNGKTLYINADQSGGGGSDSITHIGDTISAGNSTHITVDDNAGEVSIQGGAIHLYGAVDTQSTATIASTLTVLAGGAVLEYDGTLPVPTVFSVYNTSTPANTLTLNGLGIFSTLNTSGTLQYGAASGYADAFSITTATTGVTTIGSWTKTAYRSFEFDIQGSKGTTGPYQFTKILAVHDGTSATSTQLSNISTGATLGTYTVDISGTLLRLRVTPGATTSTVFKTLVKAIPV